MAKNWIRRNADECAGVLFLIVLFAAVGAAMFGIWVQWGGFFAGDARSASVPLLFEDQQQVAGIGGFDFEVDNEGLFLELRNSHPEAEVFFAIKEDEGIFDDPAIQYILKTEEFYILYRDFIPVRDAYEVASYSIQDNIVTFVLGRDNGSVTLCSLLTLFILLFPVIFWILFTEDKGYRR